MPVGHAYPRRVGTKDERRVGEETREASTNAQSLDPNRIRARSGNTKSSCVR